MGSVLAAGCHSAADKRRSFAAPSGPLLIADLEVLDLGTLQHGEIREGTVKITNPTDQAVAITKLETDCSWLKVVLDADVVPPRGSVAARVVVDMREEREFVGRLGMGVRGSSKPGCESFVVQVKVNVALPTIQGRKSP